MKGLLRDVEMGIRDAQRMLRPQTPAAAGSHHYSLSQGGHSVTKSPLKVKAARERDSWAGPISGCRLCQLKQLSGRKERRRHTRAPPFYIF